MKKLLVCLVALCIIGAVPLVHAAAAQPLGFIAPKAEERFLSPASSGGDLSEYLDTERFASYLRGEFSKGTTMIDVEAFGIPFSQAGSDAVAHFLRNEMVDCFHVRMKGLWGVTGESASSLEIEYAYTPAEYAAMLTVWQENTAEILSGIVGNTSLTDAQKALLIHDRLAVLCEYDYENLLNKTVPDASYDAHGVLVNEIAVCQGYAEAYMYLLGQIGIESYICSSEVLDHAWNIVRIDGQYYHVDVTWDDPSWDVGGRVRHEYFLRSSLAFLESHGANDYDTTPTDTTYDHYFWQNSTTAFQIVDGVLYYIDNADAHLKRYDGTALLSVDDIWPMDEMYYWDGNFTQLSSDGKDLYYSQSDAVYRYDLCASTAEKVFEPGYTFGEYFSIYGFTYEDGTFVCEMNDSPNFEADTKAKYRVTGTAGAPALIASGICGAEGDNLVWLLTADGTLTIRGTGAMADWLPLTMPWYDYKSSIKTVVIEHGVTTVGDYAFYSCGLTSVTIPDSVASIGVSAFSICGSLTSVTIPEGVASIKNGAFSDSGLTTVTIPASVTSIGNSAFSCDKLTAITVDSGNAVYYDIDGVLFSKDENMLLVYPEGKPEAMYAIPDGTASIGTYAFSYCDNFTVITMPASVTSIGDYAFAYCDGLHSITIPGSVTSVGMRAFGSCKSLASVTVSNGVASIGSSAFSNCASLLSIHIPASVTSMGSDVFGYCDSLVNVTVDANNTVYCDVDGVLFNKDKTTLYTYPAAKTESSYAIPDGVTTIEYCTFQNCTNLTSITIPASVTLIQTGAFSGCTGLQSVTIPNGVITIGWSVFSECTNLQSVTVPASVVTIGGGSFGDCPNLTISGYTGSASETYANENGIPFVSLGGTVEIAAGTCGENLTWSLASDGTLTVSGTGTMDNWGWWEDVPWSDYVSGVQTVVIENGVTSIGKNAFGHCYNLTDITIPDSVASIEGEPFAYCFSLTGITIPAGVTSIADNAFHQCENLTRITVDSGNAAYCDVDGVLFTKDMKTLVTYPDGKEDASYVIPVGVTSIGVDAFAYCDALTSVTIPASVTSIGWSAFSGCDNLASVIIVGGVTSIGSSAFSFCTSLQSITIPASVTSMESNVFGYCDSLVNITVDINNPAYCDVDGVLFTKDMKTLIAYPCGKTAASYVIPDGVTAIGENAFLDCASLTGITMPASVFSIGMYAFSGCNILTISGYTGSAAEAYANENNISFVSLGTAVHVEVAVGTCGDNLTWSLMSDGTLTISGTGAMDNWDNRNSSPAVPWYSYQTFIKQVVIGNGVTSVGEQAFADCFSLTSVALPDGLTSIEDHAFIECVSLTGITIPASVTFIGNQAFAYCDGLTGVTVDGENADYCDVDGVLFTKDMKTLITYPAAKTDASYVIPDSVTFVGTSAFAGCTSLQSVTVPASVMSIGSFAFSGCDNLTVSGYTGSAAETYANENGIPFVSLGNAAVVESTSGTCGADGDNLTWKLTFDGTLTISGTGAMADFGLVFDASMPTLKPAPWNSHNNDIKAVVIENGVTSIGSQAFSNCTVLLRVTLPDSVTSIGANAFLGCFNLTEITIPAGVVSLGELVFSGCPMLQNITVDSGNAKYCDVDGVLFSKDKVTLWAYPAAKTGASYVIPNSVTSVGDSAFASCSNLTEITIPASVASIGFSAFSSCIRLCSITVDSENVSYCDVDGVLFTKDKTRLISYPAAKTDVSYVIPLGVANIERSAFSSCANLQSVTIPNGVSSLGILLFIGCTNLTDVTIPESVTSIEQMAFFGCDITIHGYTGSYAETFAKDNNIPFAAIASVKGDVNLDGVFDYYDVANLYAIYRGKGVPAAGAVTDIDGDGTFDYYDVARLYAIYRGKTAFD